MGVFWKANGSIWNHAETKELIDAAVPVGTNWVADGTAYRRYEMNAASTIRSRMETRRARPARSESFATRFTAEEVASIEKAAQAAGLTAREWSREVLLDAAGKTARTALFTELIATRMLLVNLLKPLALGEKVSPSWITEAMTMVRKEKHKAAQEVMQQYTQQAEKEPSDGNTMG
jgi:hypothetical protein